MTRRRWIADEVKGTHATLTGANAAHLARVLRATIGQEFDVATGQEVRVGRVVSVAQDRVEFELGDVVEAPSLRPITVALAVFKFDRFEWAVEKCTELGVAKIVPILARRTEAHLAAAAVKRVERWRRICREASQQSRRATPPEVTDPVKLKQYLAEEQDSQRIVLAETEQKTLLRELVRGEQHIILAVGPEGGWSEDEFKLFAEAGWQPASLGETILRAETAAIAGVAIAAALGGSC